MEGVLESIIADLNAWCKKDDCDFVITSPSTWVYNCIAFAMGSQDIWVASSHPKHGFYAWWPPTVNRDSKPQSLIDAFKYLGFEICDDINMEDGFDKVVLYRKLRENGDYTWTHAARVLSCNRLHSKLGACHDVHHRAGDIFEECDYLYEVINCIYDNLDEYEELAFTLKDICDKYDYDYEYENHYTMCFYKL